RKVLAPGQEIPTTPGRHEVTVRVITDSNVYKDVVVVVNIPAVTVDPVDITDFEAGSNSVVLTPRSKTDQIFANVKGKSVKLVRQEDGTYAAQDNAANVTVTTDANGAITLTLPEGEKFAEGDRVVTRGENAASYEQDGFVKSSEVEKFATPDKTAPAKPEIKTDLAGKVGTQEPVVVHTEPNAKVELFDKDGNKIGEGTADKDGVVTITPTKPLEAGNVTAKAT
ncbi:TPA: hypothetical protein ACGO4F_002443, partial [Streptococcus suis]